jgi:DNA-binding HxlR family transcriptional regulator
MDGISEKGEKSCRAATIAGDARHKPNLDETCVVHQALNLLANKWLLLILLALMQRTKRNSELQRQIRGVSPKMLSQSLRQLEERGLIQRQVYAEVPPRVEYSLTDLGQSLAPLLAELCEWSVLWESRGQALKK